MSLARQTRNANVKRLCELYQAKRKEYKDAIAKRKADKSISLKDITPHIIALQKLPRNSSWTRYRNRCSITGRSRRFLRFFGICGHELRRLAMSGELPGIIQKSW
jgi:small subunit ribosomal protein S14